MVDRHERKQACSLNSRTARAAALSGARWTVAARVGLQLVTWPATLIVIRLLDSSDYGVFAIALLFIGFIALFAELGLGVALVQTRDVDERMARAASTVVLMLNGLMALAIIALAPWVAWVYAEPAVTLVMWVLTLELLIAAFAAVPLALLERELQFRSIALAQVAGGFAGAAVTLAAAVLDASVWALVAGNMVMAFVRSGMLIAFHGGLVRPGRVSRISIQPLLRVSGHVISGRVLWYWSQQADQLVVGKLLNAMQLGFFSVAAQLAMLPAGKVMEVVNRVAFPILSRVQADRQALREMHFRIVGLLAMYGFGVCWGLAAIAHDFVWLVLGAKWAPTATPLAMLALVAPLRMLCAFQNTMTLVAGAPEAGTKELALAGVLIPCAVTAGVWWNGVAGASIAWLLAFPIVYWVSNRLTCAAIGAPIRAGLRPLAAPFWSGCAMLAAIWLVRRAIGTEVPTALLLAVEIVVGGTVYLAAISLLAKTVVLEAKTILLDILVPGRAKQ